MAYGLKASSCDPLNELVRISMEVIQFNSIQYFISITIHQKYINQNITKHSVQQKDKKVMEEKAGRPKRPDNSLPLLMPNYEQKQVY